LEYFRHFSSSFPLTAYGPAVGAASLFSFSRARACLFDLRQKKGEGEKTAPDAMCGNLYVSGLVGSDATANPLPAVTSTSPTRTHNQPQPHLLPFSTVATAALQNNRDDPHLAGNEACLCSLCHIKDRFFPRSQDGRIVLPHPTTTSSVHSHSTRHHRTTASMTSATPLPTPALPTHRRNRTNSTASNRDREWGSWFFLLNLSCLIYG
jgi:hypothetical protein